LIDSQNEDGFDLLGSYIRVIAPVAVVLSIVFLLLSFVGSHGHILGALLSWSVYVFPFLSLVFATRHLVNRRSLLLNRTHVIVALRVGFSLLLWILTCFAITNSIGLLLVLLPFIAALAFVNWILYSRIHLLEN
jgi:hypothetical protein